MSINRLSSPVHAAPPAPHAATDGTGAEKRMPPAPGASDALRTALTERPQQQQHAGEAATPPRMALAKLLSVPPARTDSLVEDEVKAIAAKVCGDVTLRATHSAPALEAATRVAWKGLTDLTRDLSPGRQ